MGPRVAMPERLTAGDSIVVVLIFALYLVMLAGISIAMPLRRFGTWRLRRWP